ncbi:MAG: S4 domain-containing protein, partial [Candidatus Odinarchaeota archaeon]
MRLDDWLVKSKFFPSRSKANRFI